MSCQLNAKDVYRVGVVREVKGRLEVELINPPATCADGVLNNSKTKVEIREGIAPTVSWSNTEKRPILSVPNKDYILRENNSDLLFGVLVALGAIAIVVGIGFFLNRKEKDSVSSGEDEAPPSTPPPTGGFTPRSQPSNPGRATFQEESRSYRPGAPQPTVHHHHHGGGGSGDLATGLVLGNILGGNHSSHTHEKEIIRETVRESEPEPKFESDEPVRSSFQSDTPARQESFESEAPAESFGSDNKDSGSSFSSDTGGSSFGSDAGGGGSDFGGGGGDSGGGGGFGSD